MTVWQMNRFVEYVTSIHNVLYSNKSTVITVPCK